MSTEKIERVILIAERLIAALEADIAALQSGTPQKMKTIDPEIQKLSMLYAREAGALAGIVKTAPDDLRSKLSDTTARFREALLLQRRLLTRVRNASEGMIQAVAQEVERRRTMIRPYGRPATPTPPRSQGAMIYNAVA